MDHHLIVLSPEARSALDIYRGELEPQLRPGGTLRDIPDWVLKLPGAVARIAGTLHLVEHSEMAEPWTVPISVDTMESAIRLGRYFAEHALAAFGLMGAAGEFVSASELWAVIERRGFERFTSSELQQLVKGRHTAGEIAGVLDTLEDMGYVRRIQMPSPSGAGRPPSPTYEVNPLALQGNHRSQDLQDIQGHAEKQAEEPRTRSTAAPLGTEEPLDTLDYENVGTDENPTNPENPPSAQDQDPVALAGEDDFQDFQGCQPASCDGRRTHAGVAVSPMRPQFITGVDEANRVVGELRSEPVVGLDLETTGLDSLADNIRLVQLATSQGTWVFDAYQVPIDVFKPVLESGPVKIVQNGKFDWRFLYQAGVSVDSVFDTLLADQVLHNRSYGRNLGDLAHDYLGETVSKELQKSDWSGDLSSEQIEYAGRDAAILMPLGKALVTEIRAAGVDYVARMENAALPAVAWMEHNGVAFDLDRWEGLAQRADAQVAELEGRLNEIASAAVDGGTVNWNSTAQVLKVLKTIGVDVPNTQQRTLEARRNAHPIVPALLEYREAAKRAGTYGQNWLKYMNPATGRIHADWRQIGAESGRMSCRNPNLQNLPRSQDYRACFNASPGRVLIKADYGQIELRIAAEVAGDTAMVEAFHDNQDLHTLTAMYINGKKDISEVTQQERQLAKALNFGLIYGMGAERLASNVKSDYGIDLTLGQAKEIRRRFFGAFPGLRVWHRLQGTVKETRTQLGRRRRFNGGRSYTQLLNSPIQGTGADGLKIALALLWRRRALCPDTFPVLAVHDEIVVEAPRDKGEEAKEWLIGAMVDGMRACLKDVPVAIDAEIRETW